MASPCRPEPTRHSARWCAADCSGKCPWCGDRQAYFIGWFSKQRALPQVRHAYRRGDDGFELGAVTANTIFTFAVIIVAGAVAMIATSPDIPTV